MDLDTHHHGFMSNVADLVCCFLQLSGIRHELRTSLFFYLPSSSLLNETLSLFRAIKAPLSRRPSSPSTAHPIEAGERESEGKKKGWASFHSTSAPVDPFPSRLLCVLNLRRSAGGATFHSAWEGGRAGDQRQLRLLAAPAARGH